MTKDEVKIIQKIIDRAEKMELLAFDRIMLKMDLEFTHEKFNLRLNDLLDADDFNFSHDIVGIQNHIDRRAKDFTDFFLPRFARPNPQTF